MHDDLLKHIKGQSPEDQYQYFLNRVAEFEVLWGLYHEKKEGWAMTTTEEGKEMLALWPSPDLAGLNANGPWASYQTETLDLMGFVENGIEELKAANRGVSLLYLPNEGGLEVDLNYLHRDLEALISEEEADDA